MLADENAIYDTSKGKTLIDIGLRNDRDSAETLAKGRKQAYPGAKVRVFYRVVKVDHAQFPVFMVTARRA